MTDLILTVTQSKSPTLLLAIQYLYPVFVSRSPPNLTWKLAKTIPTNLHGSKTALNKHLAGDDQAGIAHLAAKHVQG